MGWLIFANDLHKTSKGLRDMNYQDTQQFERATMLKLPIQPLLVLCGVMPRFYFFDFQYLKNYFTIKLKIRQVIYILNSRNIRNSIPFSFFINLIKS